MTPQQFIEQRQAIRAQLEQDRLEFDRWMSSKLWIHRLVGQALPIGVSFLMGHRKQGLEYLTQLVSGVKSVAKKVVISKRSKVKK